MISLPRHLIYKHGSRKATQLRVLAYVRHLGIPNGGYWFESDDQVAATLNISRKTLVRSYVWLTEQGYLEQAGYWRNSRRKRYKLASLNRHDDPKVRASSRITFSEDQIKDNDSFLSVLVTFDIKCVLKVARYENNVRTKEALACRRGKKGTITKVRLPFAYFCNRFLFGTRKFKRIQQLGNKLKLFVSMSEKIAMPGLSPWALPFIDRRTEDGYLYMDRSGVVFERKITSYSIYKDGLDTACSTGLI